MNLVSASQATRELVSLAPRRAVASHVRVCTPNFSVSLRLDCWFRRFWSATLKTRWPSCLSLRTRWGRTARARHSGWLTWARAQVSLAWCLQSLGRAGKSHSSTPWRRCECVARRECSAPARMRRPVEHKMSAARVAGTPALTRVSAAARPLPGTCGRDSPPCQRVLAVGCELHFDVCNFHCPLA